MNPFEYVTAINESKKDLMQNENVQENSYNSYLVNRSLSYFSDTVAAANEMNRYHFIDNKLQFHFLLNIIRKRKRFSKWIKPEVADDVDAVKEYYDYSNEKAKSVLNLLSPDQIKEIKRRIYKGGRKQK